MKYSEEQYDIETQDFQNLKDKYWSINQFNADGNLYYYRPLTRKEYNYFLSVCTNPETGDINEEEFKDLVVESCVFLPTSFNLENEKAGIIERLYNEIIAESGFEDWEANLISKIKLYKIEMVDPINQIGCYIKEAFPDLTLEEIEDFSLDKLAWYFSRANFTLKYIRGQKIDIFEKETYLDYEELIDDYNEIIGEEGLIQEEENNKQVTKDELDISGGSMADFPELIAYKRFMEGKDF